ncbi:MAG: acetyl-CoA decarbonylase/synthase complex subunit delta [Oscillospiraceae bacterium]|nr:acetyl-CoA decarbonylase/synthase complex subunit delta [Oscillospiraceae bacterium]
MGFKRVPQKFPASINEVVIGTGDKAIKLGGETVMPLYTFDAEIANRPVIGVEISDHGYDKTVASLAEYYAGAETLADIAKKAAAMPGADFVVFTLEGADPNGENKSVEECVAAAKEVADAIDLPLAVMGCKNGEKDAELFNKIADALQGKNVLFVSAKEENYKQVAVSAGLAYNQKLSAESAVDINLAKQLNVLISQMGLKADTYMMNVGSASAGYGFEYVVSTMDQVKGAALSQNDAMLQMPIITPVASETWNVKESIVSEEDFPEWGSRDDRAVQMEVCTASACIAAGSNAVILRHPQSVATVAKLVAELM